LARTHESFVADPLKQFVDGQIAQGRYSSVSEYVRELIRADEKRKADEASVAAKKLEEQKRQAERIEKERARQQADADRKAAEDARRKQEEDQKREKTLAEAAARLKQAQTAYQTELAKTSKGGQK